VVDKKEQRKRDQALGLVPFAVKLNDLVRLLVQQLHASCWQGLAKEALRREWVPWIAYEPAVRSGVATWQVERPVGKSHQ
jgi:hypothetical protein